MHIKAIPDKPLDLQDFAALGVESAGPALSTANRVLRKAVDYYKNFLPEPIALGVPNKRQGSH